MSESGNTDFDHKEAVWLTLWKTLPPWDEPESVDIQKEENSRLARAQDNERRPWRNTANQMKDPIIKTRLRLCAMLQQGIITREVYDRAGINDSGDFTWYDGRDIWEAKPEDLCHPNEALRRSEPSGVWALPPATQPQHPLSGLQRARLKLSLEQLPSGAHAAWQDIKAKFVYHFDSGKVMTLGYLQTYFRAAMTHHNSDAIKFLRMIQSPSIREPPKPWGPIECMPETLMSLLRLFGIPYRRPDNSHRSWGPSSNDATTDSYDEGVRADVVNLTGKDESARAFETLWTETEMGRDEPLNQSAVNGAKHALERLFRDADFDLFLYVWRDLLDDTWIKLDEDYTSLQEVQRLIDSTISTLKIERLVHP